MDLLSYSRDWIFSWWGGTAELTLHCCSGVNAEVGTSCDKSFVSFGHCC